MQKIEQGTVRAGKKENAIIKLKRKYKGKTVDLKLENVNNTKWDYIVIIYNEK